MSRRLQQRHRRAGYDPARGYGKGMKLAFAALAAGVSPERVALERLFARWDSTLRRFRAMPDEERLRFVVRFIRVESRAEVRDVLLSRFSERTNVTYGWRPGSLDARVVGLSSEYRGWVDLQLTLEPRLTSGRVYTWSPR